jgi:hypothetical protein
MNDEIEENERNRDTYLLGGGENVYQIILGTPLAAAPHAPGNSVKIYPK